jgi:F-type H+-transporting ATPase subunit beta
MNTGRIVQIMGPVVDVAFDTGTLPEIYTALEITNPTDEAAKCLVCEVQQHLGEGTVRTVAMGSTDGFSRGVEVRDTGSPITTPVGREVLGRIINVTGDPSVDPIATVRTVPSPRCCCTSQTRHFAASSVGLVISRAV